jgi:hypothetical protein
MLPEHRIDRTVHDRAVLAGKPAMVQRRNPVDPKQDGIIAQYVCPDALKYGDGRIHRVAHHQNAGSGLGRRNRLRGNLRGIIQQGEKSQSYGFGAPGATRGLQLFRA